jgi:ParB/RepB/Spo0J family partition protein
MSDIPLGRGSVSESPQTPLTVQRSLITMPNVFSRSSQSALVSSNARPVIGEQYAEVSLDAVTNGSPVETRAPFAPEDDEEDAALLESLRSEPQREPVQLKEKDGTCPAQYVVLDGHRRIAALRKLGQKMVKAIIKREGTLDCDLITLTANVRKNLTPLELARSVERLHERHGLTYVEIGQRAGVKKRYLLDLMAMLRSDPAVLVEVESGRISARVARQIAHQPGEHQSALAAVVAANELSSAATERLIERIEQTGEDPTSAARALGLTVVTSATGSRLTSPTTVLDTPETSPAEDSESIPRPAASDASASALERFKAILASTLPELSGGPAEAIAGLCVRQSLNPSVLKIAGLIALANANTTSEQAVRSAALITKSPGVHEIVQIIDACASLRTILRAGKMHRDISPLVSSLDQIVSQLLVEVNALKRTSELGHQG